MIQKIKYRQRFKKIRNDLAPSRRLHAAAALANHFAELFPSLSFYSFGSEIDTSLLNRKLSAQKKLFLPRIEDQSLAIYRVDDLEKIRFSPQNKILEPDPFLCPKADLSEIKVILVPGIAFDTDHYRIGYGNGFYDRLLTNAKEIRSIGVGFQEQFSSELLPKDPWDVPVHELLLI